MADWEVAVAEVKGDVKNLSSILETHIAEDDKKWDRNSVTHKELYQRTERPSWAHAWILGGLLSAVVGLSVYLVTRG